MTTDAMPDTTFIPLCTLADLPIVLGRLFEITRRQIAVFRTRKSEVFALDNRCPHKAGPLSEGMISRDAAGNPQVVCPLHAFRFAATGGTCDEPHTCPVQTPPLRVVDDQVFIKIPA